MQVPKEYLNSKLLLVLQIFNNTCIHIWFVAISVLSKILLLNTMLKGKEKDKEMFKHLLFTFLSGAVFFQPPVYWPHFESSYSGRSSSLWNLQYPYYLKNTINLWFFFEHKLYGFAQSELEQ